MSFFTGRRQNESDEPTTPPKPEAAPPQTRITPNQPIGFETVLGANATLKGDFTSHANVRLDGTFTGTLEITGNILIGETAKITADVNARNISIAGAVRGNVNGKKVQILRTGRVWGDITATALTTEEGAFIDGKISMVSHEAAKQAEAKSQSVEASEEKAEDSGDVHVISAEVDDSTELPDFLDQAALDDATVSEVSQDADETDTADDGSDDGSDDASGDASLDASKDEEDTRD